jgi:hypothetical protein
MSKDITGVDRLKAVAEADACVSHMVDVLEATWSRKTCEYGTWGGELRR